MLAATRFAGYIHLTMWRRCTHVHPSQAAALISEDQFDVGAAVLVIIHGTKRVGNMTDAMCFNRIIDFVLRCRKDYTSEFGHSGVTGKLYYAIGSSPGTKTPWRLLVTEEGEAHFRHGTDAEELCEEELCIDLLPSASEQSLHQRLQQMSRLFTSSHERMLDEKTHELNRRTT